MALRYGLVATLVLAALLLCRAGTPGLRVHVEADLAFEVDWVLFEQVLRDAGVHKVEILVVHPDAAVPGNLEANRRDRWLEVPLQAVPEEPWLPCVDSEAVGRRLWKVLSASPDSRESESRRRELFTALALHQVVGRLCGGVPKPESPSPFPGLNPRQRDCLKLRFQPRAP